ncbi:hypothetical protein ODE01S_20320 [Oceanithermus desulfurans NBRC 100063]|uniref:Uncharacterized protein n=1 Tax=Oceanithermus desulfurans NBRC 100063 TaxID=1227550 RepID=A0A511RLR2_9DEIN|nr:hypothetical protein ODE01S_20320 [Oceanithermus desulfurans NBRC 100063]
MVETHPLEGPSLVPPVEAHAPGRLGPVHVDADPQEALVAAGAHGCPGVRVGCGKQQQPKPKNDPPHALQATPATGPLPRGYGVN